MQNPNLLNSKWNCLMGFHQAVGAPEMIPHVQAVLKEYMKGATKQGFSVSIYTF